MSLLNLLHLVASISPHCLQSASRLRASLRCRLPHLPSFLSPFSIFLSVSRNIVIILSHVNWGVSEAITKRGARQQQLTGGREGQDTQEAKPGRIRLSLTLSPFAYAHTQKPLLAALIVPFVEPCKLKSRLTLWSHWCLILMLLVTPPTPCPSVVVADRTLSHNYRASVCYVVATLAFPRGTCLLLQLLLLLPQIFMQQFGRKMYSWFSWKIALKLFRGGQTLLASVVALLCVRAIFGLTDLCFSQMI